MLYYKVFFVSLFLTLSTTLVSGQSNSTSPVKIFLFAGQSNMDGCGKPEELPEKYKVHPENTTTWDNKKESWVNLDENTFAKRRNHYFGPEIAFSHRLAKAYPESTIAVIKTSAGGTGLYKHWLPGKAMYKHFLKNINNALEQLQDSGVVYEICGMLWMQGETDSETVELASAYEDNLKVFFDGIRDQTGKKDLPIVMGRISSSILKETPWVFDHAEIVQKGQENVAKEDKRVSIINTDKLKTWTDNTHFDGESQIWLGEKMGKLMLRQIR